MKRKFDPPSFVNGGQGHKKREGAHASGQSSSQQAAQDVQVAKNRPPLQDISNVQSSCHEAAVSRSKDAGKAATAKKEDLTLSGKTFHSVMYIKRELFMKKKVSKAWSDGVLSRAPAGEAVLHDLSTGKVVSSGRVKEVTELQLLGPAALSYKDRQKMGKGAGKGAAEDDEEDQECRRPLLLLNSMVIEVEEEMDAERFRSGACFTATPITAAAIAASKPGGSLKAGKGFKVPSMAGNGKASQLASRPVVAMPLPTSAARTQSC